MTTTTVQIEITCPDWCEVSPEDHAGDLWDMGGICAHRSADIVVEDTEGYSEPLQAPRMHPTLEFYMSTTTTPGGRLQSTPMIILGGDELSPTQAELLAEKLLEAVQTLRTAAQA